MNNQLHGIAYDNSLEQGSLYYSIIHLLHLLNCYSHPVDRELLPEWSDIWIDRKAQYAVKKFQDCFWKIDRTATLLYTAVEHIQVYSFVTNVEEYGFVQDALIDIPIYLDSLLFYLRIQADCLANLIPNFYGKNGQKQNIARDSFRDQIRWFKKHQFDPDYTTILSNYTEWFRLLAGDQHGQGLRDKAAHRRGIYQLTWSGEVPQSIEDLRAMMVNDSGFINEHLIMAIVKIMKLYFDYLDLTYRHFIEKIRNETQDSELLLNKENLPYFTFSGGPSKSTWIYPKIPDERIQ